MIEYMITEEITDLFGNRFYLIPRELQDYYEEFKGEMGCSLYTFYDDIRDFTNFLHKHNDICSVTYLSSKGFIVILNNGSESSIIKDVG